MRPAFTAAAALAAAALAACTGTASAQPFSIDAFGAVAGVDTRAQAVANGAAFVAAVSAANASTDASRRAVLVPQGSTYAFLPSVPVLQGLVNVSVLLEGTLALYTSGFADASNPYPGWPEPWTPLSFYGCSGLRVASETGQGVLNGRGNLWWWYTLLVADHRPNLLEIDSSSDVTLTGITLLNSPRYHANLDDVLRADVRGVTVRVDIADQLAVYRYMGAVPSQHFNTQAAAAAGASTSASEVAAVLRSARQTGPSTPDEAEQWEQRGADLAATAPPAHITSARAAALPPAVTAAPWFRSSWSVTPPVPMIWALNTDGIDIAGQGITVSNCSVTNFDDTVCVKPLRPGGSVFNSTCTGNFNISDITVTYGVGISLGSVPPDATTNCIDGIIASNITFHSPLKAIYIKPNPAKQGSASGLIANALYQDVEVNDPLWWPIWLGTQQQQQPGTSGTGCSFLYPLFNSSCPTDPQVTVANITLRNVRVHGGIFSPGVLLANASNPATGLVWDGVVFSNASHWPVQQGYLCDGVEGVALHNTTPVPPCFTVARDRE